ncbi:MAG: hypothetical protein Q4A31_04765 [Corynebacterium sp.]|uniref:hypothetical protein n=1 Tax=Corynebacterium sp. TaxID=1720 RepID=UPI0026DB5BDA|nr:hypothetical protein [Corynebacterium sp.]MDO4761209.1 hypothetical protein [Corynebacterium sp.]
MTVKKNIFVALVASAALTLGACSNSNDTQPDQPATTSHVEVADGPHADPNRPLAPEVTRTNDAGTATITEVDLGNVEDGQYRAPLRGVLITPTNSNGPAPLIVISHLRAPNCGDYNFAYPCAEGEKENRYDHGMIYLGEAFAAQGYATVIPDLGGIFSGADTTEPYNQNALWKQSVTTLVDQFPADSVDLTKVGLFAHSRSGTVVETAAETFGAGNLRSVFAYGPAYDTVELEEISPQPSDIAYLAMVGDADSDVGPSANLWIGHYLDQERTQPALVTQVPGLGHMLINRNGKDDRIGCDEMDCPDAAEHERIMSTVATDWFNATVRGMDTELPIHSDSELPAQLAGVDVRWLAATHAPHQHLSAQQLGSVCRHADPMNPVKMDNPCTEPEDGVVQILTEVSVLKEASVDTSITSAKSMAIHLAPSGTHESPTKVTISLTLDNGVVLNLPLDPAHPALKSRKTQFENGTYTLGTIRMTLPDNAQEATITNVRVHAPNQPVEIRGIDFLT